MLRVGNFHKPVTLTLVLGVAQQNLLLLLDQLDGAHRLGGGVRVAEHLVGVSFFLGGDLSHGGALVVQRLDAAVQRGQFVAHADDFEQRVGLFLVARLHKAGQVQGQHLHKLIQQLLPGAAARGVGDGQGAVFAAALHHDAVGERYFQVRRRDGPITGRSRRAELLAAQCPGQGVQHAGLALVVVAAHQRQPGRGGGDLHRLDALDVFRLQRSNCHRHFMASVCISVKVLFSISMAPARVLSGSLANWGLTDAQAFFMLRPMSSRLS